MYITLMMFYSVMPALSDRSSKHCRAHAYRLLRQALVDANTAEILHDIDWFIVKYAHIVLFNRSLIAIV